MADRRAPGTSWKVAATYTSTNKRWIFIASDAWYNYGNALVAREYQRVDLDGQYHFSRSPVSSIRDCFCGIATRSAANLTRSAAPRRLVPGGLPSGSSYLGGLPLFKYNRAQLEYDF